tara:strand:+ start:2144 stop:2257 length:114 start_codon:yes stop_codon:yes gene_type:complete
MRSNNKARLDDLKMGGALFTAVLILLQITRSVIISTL